MIDGRRTVAFIPPRVSTIPNNEYNFFAAMTPQMVKHVQLGARF